jgi:succinate-acetate transporter protein
MGVFLLLWGVFTLYMFMGTLRLNRMLQLVFFTLTILYFLLAATEFTGNASLGMLAGYEGILCGLCAMYGSAALILNEVYGTTILPVGNVAAKKVFVNEDSEASLFIEKS